MRASGILMHVTSLPGPNGIGAMGKPAHRFVDFLEQAGQKYWQVLPLSPTGYGDSPYQSFSAFAGNHYLIDLELLVDEGLLRREEVEAVSWSGQEDRVDYGILYENRGPVLYKAYERFLGMPNRAFHQFIQRQQDWLQDYALFMALKEEFQGKPWQEWPDGLRLRQPEEMAAYREKLKYKIAFQYFLQFKFFEQWDRLHRYAKSKGVRVIGDVPIYVPLDSADVWSNCQLFQLDEDRKPRLVAGVPPDAFTADGQLWGNPLYDWEYHRRTGYAWWISRVRHALSIYDILRIDHFRGFDTYWAIPAGETTARNGRWEQGPRMELFHALHNALGSLPIVAEDLGEMFDSVRELLAESGFPGMKVLQFAFTGEDSVDLPHNYPRNCVAYPGTHDNNTLAGWFAGELTAAQRKQATDYFALTGREGNVRGLLRGVLASAAALAIIPLADWLEEPAASRMNTPGKARDNWQWRADAKKLTPALAGEIRELSERYFRTAR